jgi:hypothetical protein
LSLLSVTSRVAKSAVSANTCCSSKNVRYFGYDHTASRYTPDPASWSGTSRCASIKRVRVFEGQRLEENRVDDGEHGGVRADAERKGRDGDGGERRGFTEKPK